MVNMYGLNLIFLIIHTDILTDLLLILYEIDKI